MKKGKLIILIFGTLLIAALAWIFRPSDLSNFIEVT